MTRQKRKKTRQKNKKGDRKVESNDSTKIPEGGKHQISPASFQEAANDGSDKGCKQTINNKLKKSIVSKAVEINAKKTPRVE